MGHIGLTPQSANQLGGLKVQAKSVDAAKSLVEDAKALEQAGAFAVVLEAVPARLAAIVTETVGIPTIGIGAGSDCDGQVQVVNDVLGLYGEFVPKHAKRYANLTDAMRTALAEYFSEVKDGAFPTSEHSFLISREVLAELRKEYGGKK